MRTGITAITVLTLIVATYAESIPPNALTTQEVSEGWILLFDGQTSFGWKTDVEPGIDGGAMTPGAGKMAFAHTTTEFSDFELAIEYRAARADDIKLVLNENEYELAPSPAGGDGSWMQGRWQVRTREARPEDIHALALKPNDKKKQMVHDVTAAFAPAGTNLGQRQTSTGKKASRTSIGIRMPVEAKASFRNIKLKPSGARPIFNGKDLTGWKEIPGHKSKFTVTQQGELNIKDGNGDIQTEEQWDDFVLQLDVYSNGEHLNSGIFFRAVPGEFWSGYECQIRNEWKGYEKGKPRNPAIENRTEPVDFGTGGLYSRQPTRKVIPNDREWFTVTVVADGAHLATWINGIQCTDYVDGKKDGPNPRAGRYTGPGVISLQGHDPTTDLSFRNIRVAELGRR